MMLKRITALFTALIALLGACLFAGCDGETEPSDSALSQRAHLFLTLVEEIETPVTLSAEVDLNAARLVYGFLDESDRARREVGESYARLQDYQAEYDALVAEAEREDFLRAEAVRIEAFLQAAGALPDVGYALSDREAVDRAKALYETLSPQSKERADVAEAYAALTEADEAVSALEEAAWQALIKERAESFIEGVGSLGDVSLDSAEALWSLSETYERFSDEIKAYDGVEEAKQKLDEAFATYRALVEERDVAAFLEAAANIGEPVTLGSLASIVGAESLYAYLSDGARARTDVAEAYDRVKAARARYDELFAEAEEKKVQAFLRAVEAIPQDIENVDMGWFGALRAAETAYGELSLKTREREDVAAAFARWNVAQRAFDQKGYRQIPMKDPNLLPDGNSPTYLVLQNEGAMFAALYDFYGVNGNAALAERCVCWLDVFVDGVFIAKGELDLLQVGHIVHSSEILRVLKALSAQYPAIRSGAAFGFAIHFSDREEKFIPSDMTKVMTVPTERNYTW